MHDQKEVLVWKTYLFNEISSGNFACIIVEDNDATSE